MQGVNGINVNTFDPQGKGKCPLTGLKDHIVRPWQWIAMRLRTLPTVRETDGLNGCSTIKKQLGTQWEQLHPNIQRRFGCEPEKGGHIFYLGVMQRVECSRAGCLFAHFTRVIGNPLTPFRGKEVRMDVVLYQRKNRAGVYWRRTYYYPHRTPYTVTSVKRENRRGEMQECVGGGFGMLLNVYAEGGSLHFRSYRYFWQCGPLRILLPHLLTPGETHVMHEDLGGGTFRFTISMEHPFLGRTFYQEGIFSEETAC